MPQLVIPAKPSAAYFVVRNQAGEYWNTDGTPAFEAYDAGNWGDYAISLTQSGASQHYAGTFPAVAAGVYELTAYSQVGGSPAITDILAGTDRISWNGASAAHEQVRCCLEAAVTSSAGSTLRVSAWLEKNGQFVDLADVDDSANCTVAVREHGAEADLFTALAATEPDANGRFEFEQETPGFTDDRLYYFTVTIEENGHTWITEHCLPVFG